MPTTIRFAPVVGLAMACCSVCTALAAPGDLDPTFGAGGKLTTAISVAYDDAEAVLVQPDGKIVVAGYGEIAGQRFELARYDSVGVLDSAFGTGGTVLTPIPGSTFAFANDAVLLPDGRIVLAGHGGGDFALARYAANGALDTTFGVNGTSTVTHGARNGVVYALARQPNGKLVAAGYLSNGNDLDFGIRRYDADGMPDLTFGTRGLVTTTLGPLQDTAADVALQADGKIVVVGDHFEPGSDIDVAVVRYDTDGTLDAAFGVGGTVVMDLGSFSDLAQAVAVQPDGKIIVAGGIDHDVMVMRLDGTGALDPTFGTGGITTVALPSTYATDVVLAPDGKIVVAVLYMPDGPPLLDDEFAVLRLMPDGTPDAGFGIGGVTTTAFPPDAARPTSLALQDDGKIVVAGYVRIDDGLDVDVALARYEGTPRACGNGVVEPGESCDDGGTLAGDGCDGLCQLESGFACAGTPSVCTAGCGDGAIAGSEACDDGGLIAGDGCDAFCALEPGWSCAGAPTTCTPICGDSRVVGPEQCDDGNVVGGDCCDASCQFEPAGSPCLDDATPCYTTDVCAAGGVCQHVPATDPACLQPTAPGRALLKIEQRADPSKSLVAFKWTKGPVVPKASFGTPSLGTTTYAVCLYDESAGVVQGILEAEPGPIGDCVGAACWKETATGWKLKSRYGSFEGVVSMKLREGLVPGRASVQAKLKGSYLSVPVPPLAQDPRVTAEVRTSDGQCFGARFSTAIRNEPGRFAAKSD